MKGPVISLIVGLVLVVGAITFAVTYEPTSSATGDCGHEMFGPDDMCIVNGRKYTHKELLEKQKEDTKTHDQSSMLKVCYFVVFAGGLLTFKGAQSLYRERKNRAS